MQRIGAVSFYINKVESEYLFTWDTDKTLAERIDIIKDHENYNKFDTSNCVASYIKKRDELELGNVELIKKMLVAKRNVAISSGKTVQSVTVEDGQVIVTSEKKDVAVGIEYKLVMQNGKIKSELYKTSEVTIYIDSIDDREEPIELPWNRGDYKKVGLSVALMSSNADCEYYTWAELRSKYGMRLDHLEKEDFCVVSSMEEARGRLSRFREAETKLKVIDVETTGTDIWMYGEDCITGVVLSYNEHESTYYPFRQEKCDNLPISFLDEIVTAVNSQPEDVKILAHGAKFEKQAFMKEAKNAIKYSDYAVKWDPKCEEHAIKNTYLRVDVCTLVLSTLVNPVVRKGVHTLKKLAFDATGNFYLELSHIFKGKIKFNVLPVDLIKWYACPDGPNPIKVFKMLIEKLPKDECMVFEYENALIDVTVQNEWYGMRTNESRLTDLLRVTEDAATKLKVMFQGIHGTSKNINSNSVKADIIYNKLRCAVEVRTVTGQPSTSKLAIDRIVEKGTLSESSVAGKPEVPAIRDENNEVLVKGEELRRNRYPSMVILQKYAKLTKESGALRRIKRNSRFGRVKFYMNQNGASSGRRTSDAHQYSDTMKSVIIADSVHHRLISCDWMQVELRVASFLARDKKLIKLESDPSNDIHRVYLSRITGKEMWDISAKERGLGKQVNFGVLYLMSAYGLARREHGAAYAVEDVRDCKKRITEFYNGIPTLKRLNIDTRNQILDKGYVKTLDGRYRYMPEVFDKEITDKKLQSIVRSGNNMPTQGLAAGMLKMVEVRILKYIRSKGWDELVDCEGVLLPKVRLMLSIHDELLLSTHEGIPDEEIIIMLKECMELKIKGAPPFFAAPAFVNNWLDGKNAAYEIPIPFRDMIIEAWEKDRIRLLRRDTYLEDLNKYRVERLTGYLDGLIKEYRTVEEVAAHVKHPELTHVLISTKIDPKKFAGDKDLTHRECILEAVRRYMESNAVEIKLDVDAVEEARVEQIDSYEDLGKYVYFDQNGEVVVENDEDEWDDEECEEDEKVDEYEKEMRRKEECEATHVKREYAFFGVDEVLIDLCELKYQSAKVQEVEVRKEIEELAIKDGEYRIVYVVAKGLEKTDKYIDYEAKRIAEIMERSVMSE